MSDIVKELRQSAEENEYLLPANETMYWAAADEIERLREALQTISDGAPFDMYGEDQYYWCQDVAWDALNEGKK